MKTKNLLMSVLAAGCLTVACLAEAATVALIPLIDRSDYKDKEELNATYISAAVRSINSSEGCTLVDTDALTNVLDKNLVEGQLPTEMAMRNIAEQSGVDIVFAMRLDKLDSSTIFSYNETTLVLDLQGKCAFYNALTGKYKAVSVDDDRRDPSALYSRDNFELRQFSNNVRHEVNRALGNKKIKAEKPRFGW